MKNMITNPAYAVPIMFTLILVGLDIWIGYRPEIQDVIRTAQNIMFGGF